MLQKNPAEFCSAGFFLLFILFKHLFRLIQSLDYRVGIIKPSSPAFREILDTSLLGCHSWHVRYLYYNTPQPDGCLSSVQWYNHLPPWKARFFRHADLPLL